MGILLSAVFRSIYPWLFISLTLSLRGMSQLILTWGAFFVHQPNFRSAAAHRRAFLKTLRKEGELLLSGDYSRQIMAGYALSIYTSPGESMVFKLLRLKMSMINYEIIAEFRDWSERTVRKFR